MTRPEAVVFDIGNVLIEWQPERFYDRVIGEPARRAMFAHVDLHAMNDRIDLGEGFATVVEGCARTYPDWADAIRLWHTNWLDMAAPAIPQSVRLMRALRARGVPVFALTNFGVETFALARQDYDFLNEFDRLYVSGHLRTAKPGSAIFAHVEADSGIAPGRLIFADDRAENIAAAKARGWQVHQFITPGAWGRALIDAGLLQEEDVA
ncbi:MAG: HAD family phosphatase [Gemmobacter sp.]|nr:HAD family phosphatase [Gemmobacter sp.]